jgi:hypothetical protein
LRVGLHSFQTILPGTPYLPNWHIDAIVYQLMRVHAAAQQRGKNGIVHAAASSLRS